MVDVRIADLTHGVSAHVSENGELITRAFDYCEGSIQSITGTTAAFNFFEPKVGDQLILCGGIASANRSVDANGTVLEIYEADASDSTTQDKLLYSLDLARQQAVNLPPTPLKITVGKYINGDRSSTAGAVTVTLFGFYVPSID